MVQEYQDSRKEREARIVRAERRGRLKFFIWIGLGVLILVGFVWWLVWAAKHGTGELPGTFYPAVGREHIGLNDPLPLPYNSNPPSSGAHYGTPANWGVYDYEVNDKIFLHNLEHGGVWIAYHASTTPSTVIDDLKAIVNELGGTKIVMAPRSANDADIALVAWTYVEKIDLAGATHLNDTQKQTIKDFYKAYRDHGPELVPDYMPGVDPKTVQ